MPGGSFAWRRLTEYHDEARDAFNVPNIRTTRNSIDIPAYYDYSPERLRVGLNGTRTTPADISNQFTDEEEAWRISPDAGNRIQLRTAERPRYIVGFEGQASLAAKMDTELGAGDTVRLGISDNEGNLTGAWFELNGDSAHRLVIQSDGTEVASTEFEFPTDPQLTPQTPIRYEIQFNWYNVGRYLFNIAYTDSSRDIGEKQRKTNVGELTVDDDFATDTGAYHIFSELDATNAGQELRAGSFAFVVLGDVEETARDKAGRFYGLSYGGSGDYEALAAMRIDPDRDNVYSQLKNVTVFPQSGSGELLAIVTDQANTDATGFATPVQHSETNSVIETTTNVSEFPDSDGNIVTSATNPNGYQVAFDAYEEAGQGNSRRTSGGVGTDTKRPLYDDDVAIFLFKEDAGSAVDVNITWVTEQDW